MSEENVRELEIRHAEDNQDLVKKHKAVQRQLKFCNQRLASVEERLSEAECTIDEVRAHLRATNLPQPDPSNGELNPRPRKRGGLLAASGDRTSTT